MNKATRATLKSFVKKNRGELLIKVQSTFDGMVDCVMPVRGGNEFSPALDTDRNSDNTLGVHGVWLVLGGRDWIERFETDDLVGLEISNCCGSFSVAIKKEKSGELGIMAAHNDIIRAKALGIMELVDEAITYHASLKAIRDGRITAAKD